MLNNNEKKKQHQLRKIERFNLFLFFFCFRKDSCFRYLILKENRQKCLTQIEHLMSLMWRWKKIMLKWGKIFEEKWSEASSMYVNDCELVHVWYVVFTVVCLYIKCAGIFYSTPKEMFSVVVDVYSYRV